MAFKQEYDVIVAGAGPAGLMAALALKDQGLTVLVCEARERHEWVFPWRVDVDVPSVLNRVIPVPDEGLLHYRADHGYQYVSPSGRYAVNVCPAPFFGLWLDDYVKALAQMLESRGGEIAFSSRLEAFDSMPRGLVRALVQSNGAQEVLKTRLVVVACGLGPQFEDSLDAVGAVGGSPKARSVLARYETWSMDNVPSPGVWPVPAGTHYFEIGTAGPFSTLAVAHGISGSSASILAASCPEEGHKSPELMSDEARRRFPGMCEPLSRHQTRIPTRRPRAALAGRGIAIIGDAAFQTSPLTGCGIALSGQAARLLAQAAQRFLHSGEHRDLWQYSVRYWHQFGSLQALSEAILVRVRQSPPDSSAIEGLFGAGFFDAAEFHRSARLDYLKVSPRDGLLKVLKLVRSGSTGVMGLGMARGLAAHAYARTGYPLVPLRSAIEAFDSRVSSFIG